MSWSGILKKLNEACYVEVDVVPGQPPKRFTTADGLASNLVTHFVVHDGSLWAACVDIYDPQSRRWEQGGFCRYDRAHGRWQRIERIGGRRDGEISFDAFMNDAAGALKPPETGTAVLLPVATVTDP